MVYNCSFFFNNTISIVNLHVRVCSTHMYVRVYYEYSIHVNLQYFIFNGNGLCF